MHETQDLKLFEIPNTLSFIKSDSGLTKVIVTNELAEAEIYLHGAHLTHFQPKGEKPLIFDGSCRYSYLLALVRRTSDRQYQASTRVRKRQNVDVKEYKNARL
jgi:hypothetical protein